MRCGCNFTSVSNSFYNGGGGSIRLDFGIGMLKVQNCWANSLHLYPTILACRCAMAWLLVCWASQRIPIGYPNSCWHCNSTTTEPICSIPSSIKTSWPIDFCWFAFINQKCRRKTHIVGLLVWEWILITCNLWILGIIQNANQHVSQCFLCKIYSSLTQHYSISIANILEMPFSCAVITMCTFSFIQIVNPAELLRIYLDYDLLEEAAVFCMEYIDAVMGCGSEYFNLKVGIADCLMNLYWWLSTKLW